jgi:signal transduction histidine kinase
VESALMTTILKQEISAAASQQLGTLKDSLLSADVTDALTSVLDNIQTGTKAVTLNINSNPSLKGIPGDSLSRLLQKALQSGDSPAYMSHPRIVAVKKTEEKPVDLDAYKKEFNANLRKRGIEVTGELALVDKHYDLVRATVDTGAFKSLAFKSDVGGFSAEITDSGDMLQAGFPEISFYLLKRMAWIVSLSVVLIIIAVVSFSYLVAQFFRQKRISEVRNDFMNNMTHELKTPISSVSVALELMQDTGNTSEASRREYYDIAQGELKRLTMLVEKVLKMAAFEKSEIKINKDNLLAAAWLQDIASGLRPLFKAKNITLETDVRPELQVMYADRTHMTNVIQNLVDNAIKYNDKEQPAIAIHIREEGNDTVIEVSDNGKGIPHGYLDKVFDKFFRVPSGDVHDVKGYGLGLSYVKAVVSLHGGNIDVRSKVGEGSVFIIRLPKK